MKATYEIVTNRTRRTISLSIPLTNTIMEWDEEQFDRLVAELQAARASLPPPTDQKTTPTNTPNNP